MPFNINISLPVLFILIPFLTSSCFSQQQSNQVQIGLSNKDDTSINHTLLYDRQWNIQSLEKQSVTTRMFIAFKPQGKVQGFSGCNRFFGGFSITGKSMQFGALAGTRKMCAQTMAFENKILTRLANVNSYYIKVNSGINTLYLLQDKTEIFSFVEK